MMAASPTSPRSTQVKRRVRDLIPALLFVVFLTGMIAIGVAAFVLGDPNRMTYGIDSYGNVCGSNKNTWNGTQGPDLTTRRHLYLLDPLSTVSLSALRGARTVCLEACPRNACDDIPCDGADDDYVYARHTAAFNSVPLNRLQVLLLPCVTSIRRLAATPG